MTAPTDADRVISHWRTATGRPANVRDRHAVLARLRGRTRRFTADELIVAIDACLADRWHQQRGMIWPAYICRDARTVESFIARASKDTDAAVESAMRARGLI